jgi:cytochrome c biogenesis protein CcdA
MAVSTILLSMTTDQFSTALMVILAYVLGMALVLLLIAGLLFMGRHLIAEKLDRLHYHVDVRLVSALMVIGIGVVYLLMNTFHLHTHAV